MFFFEKRRDFLCVCFFNLGRYILSYFVQGETECGEIRAQELGALLAGAGRAGVMLAIDWDPTALHLRYQSTREKVRTNLH